MLDSILAYVHGRSSYHWVRNALDIFLVYYLIYRALLVLRGTRAMQVGLGLGIVFLIYVLARVLELVTVLSIMSAVISSIILIIVVVFQNDIRRGLQRVGSRAWFGGLAQWQESKVIDEVVDAVTELARHRTGAIIAFEQDANLDEFVGVHKGHVIDAQVSRDLLVALFVPESINKLHDGAVVIRNYRIAKAGVFFPMPEARVVDESFGSRHRAALGITEETDAVVVIVSEERGTISFCFNGNIASNLDGPKLKTMLEAIFSPRVRKKKSRRTPVAHEGSTEGSRIPESARAARDDSETPHQRISLLTDGSEGPPSTSRDREEPASLRAPLTPSPSASVERAIRTPAGNRNTPLGESEGKEPYSEPVPRSTK